MFFVQLMEFQHKHYFSFDECVCTNAVAVATAATQMVLRSHSNMPIHFKSALKRLQQKFHCGKNALKSCATKPFPPSFWPCRRALRNKKRNKTKQQNATTQINEKRNETRFVLSSSHIQQWRSSHNDNGIKASYRKSMESIDFRVVRGNRQMQLRCGPTKVEKRGLCQEMVQKTWRHHPTCLVCDSPLATQARTWQGTTNKKGNPLFTMRLCCWSRVDEGGRKKIRQCIQA